MSTAIRGLGEIALRVLDLPAMIDFYQNVIGLELIRQDHRVAFFKIAEGFAGHTQVLALFDRSQIGGANYVPPDALKSTIDHIAFTLAREDFDLEKQRLLNLGFELTYAFHDWVGWRSLYLNDPELNVVELVCFDPSFPNASQ